MDAPKRYHPLLVTLHWIVAVLVGIELYIGLFVLSNERQGLGENRTVLAIHMATGIAILALVIARFFVRLRSKKPASANSGSPALDAIAILVHYGLYVMLLVITGVGLTMAIQTRRLQSTFLGQEPQFTRPAGIVPPGSVAPSEGPGFQPPQGGFPRGNFREGGFRTGGAFLLRGIHKLSAYIILALVVLHIAAALYHQFLRRDRLMARMWYGAT